MTAVILEVLNFNGLGANEDKRNNTLLFLRNKISEVLQEDLGTYQLFSGTGKNLITTYPAIWVSPPEVPSQYKFVENSGIECTINREGGIRTEPLLNHNYSVYEDFKITLVQRNLEKSISEVAKKIVFHKEWEIMRTPVVNPYMKTSNGFIFPQCTILISVGYFSGN